VEELYEQWRQAPESLPESWQIFFEGFDLATCPRDCIAADRAKSQACVGSLIAAFRTLGHLEAKLDPLGRPPEGHPELELDAFGLTEADLDLVFDTGQLQGPERAPLREILEILRETYCRSLGVEYMHIQDPAIRRWLQQEMEPLHNRPQYDRDRKRQILADLTEAEFFESFLQTHYQGQKRFSLEGAETLIPAIHAFVLLATELGVEAIIIGMPHRGRLNVLANILDKSYNSIFAEFEDVLIPNTPGGDGDVKYHKGYTSHHDGKITVSLTSNPSHLEAVNPVVEGRVRAWQWRLNDREERTRVVPLVIHGDAAFSGQGLVAETLNLSQLEGYRTGGSIHFIVNNQIGFTASPEEARSSRYCTDVMKMIEAPIFHVNGDDPDAVVYATELALRFRQRFGRDVAIDMVCYRRHGHSEMDDPALTHPVLYRAIKQHPSPRTIYLTRLAESGELTPAEQQELADQFNARMSSALEEVKSEEPVCTTETCEDNTIALDEAAYREEGVDTSISQARLLEVASALTTVPEGFVLTPKLGRRLPGLYQTIEEGGPIDWATAELLALGSLLREGTPVRLSGQDSMRGTFSQRHSVWHDTETSEPYIPLNHIHPDQAHFCVYNSSLTEAAVLGFEYGYALETPEMLILWEAQFGDFANGAQVIIDQFLVSSRAKWQRTTGLVMLLPHGYEGQGPEHSNAYLERYLMACAETNLQVCNFTTPAQYFHALRRQMKRSFRRPLVVMAPKSMLRHPRAVSPASELVEGRFQVVLDDPTPPTEARRIVLCTGKVFYDLLAKREEAKLDDVALLRIEHLYPFPRDELAEVLGRYPSSAEVVWAQEEPENRGAHRFVYPRILPLISGRELRYAGRRASPSPATGSLSVHRKEQSTLVDVALGILTPALGKREC
jgi:2-oxoglutarate dehydrogenase E1 component